ncbi:prepilin peptidase [Demequina pelophila]|uniref:prepilin peptidase n=1 Tax=Demequina pelophila TaxID=1638984 RepID=UPI000783BA67|nr:A24 family peptidase [Demequina pelophila]
MTGISLVAAALAGALGLALGSFANVLIHRVPQGVSVVSPASACPACGHRIRARHNVPVIGWLWLRGKCADCGAPISGRYPAVELATGLAFAGVTALTGPDWRTAMLLALVYFGIVLSAVDLETRRLPDPLTGAFAVCVAVLAPATCALTGQWDALLRAVIGAAALGALYGLAFVIYPKGMGFGDVKLAPSIGASLAFLGWPLFAVGVFAAFVWGAVAGVIAMRRARRTRGVAVPFGPWMFVGAATGVLIGAPVTQWYLELVMLA